MASTVFDKHAWQITCQQLMDASMDQAFTPMHRLFLFSQAVDEALMGIHRDSLPNAISIAQGFGYESWQERSEYVDWFTTQADASKVPQESQSRLS